jgi:hypothetical protein
MCGGWNITKFNKDALYVQSVSLHDHGGSISHAKMKGLHFHSFSCDL